MKTKDGKTWYCKMTLVSDGKIHVKWSESEQDYDGPMVHGEGNKNQPLVMGGKAKKDGSVVRFQWHSIDEVQAEWRPRAQAQAGQQEHKPAHAKGIITRKK